MLKSKDYFNVKKREISSHKENGVALIVVILVSAFLLSIGIVLVTVTSVGPKVASNIRLQDQAFNAAEAGFNTAWIEIENYFLGGSWISFDGHCLKDPAGIDIPLDQNYFRRLTDTQILNLLDLDNNGTSDYDNVIFFKQQFITDSGGGLDPRYAYTVFLIDDESGGGTPDPLDTLLICIGSVQRGNDITTSRLEIGLAVQLD